MTAIDGCPICANAAIDIGGVHSDFSDTDFEFRHCGTCGLTFVANPRVDFTSIYDAAYYRGNGADSFVNYIDEMANPGTIRMYEWRGITRCVESLSAGKDVKWLDYGCGLGGLVRYARARGFSAVYGYDQGWGADWARDQGIELLDADELREHEGTFDVITAIEVVEHVPAPLELMRHIESLLKPGGVFFLTTGNAAPHRGSFTSWKYVHPDVHVAYYEPRTLREAYRRVGLEPLDAGFLPGHEGIIRYKVLRTLRMSTHNVLERLVPWGLASRVVNRRYKVTEQPLARKPVAAPAATGSGR
jgi:SAM-dependent methyltransferase